MPDTTLTSAELDELFLRVERGASVRVNNWTLRQLVRAARAGLEAGKAEESMRERAALALDKRVTEIAVKYGDYEPDTNCTNLPAWAEGVSEELDALATAIRALPLTGDKP